MKENSEFSNRRKNILGAAWLWLGVLVIALALPLASPAQDTGYISGTVSDKSGAARIDVQLTVGAINEEIVVTGESVAQVETQSSALSSTVTGKQIDQLMLNGRNFTQLVTLTPGVVDQTGTDEGKVGVYGNVAYSMNGGRNEYNNWELDGGDNMDNGSNATLNVYPNVEAIAEFKVLTSNYGAQYGRNGSGTIEVETKSGGNAFHGSAFYYGRNEFFNARSWAEGQNTPSVKAPYRKHDYGYTIGGPVFIPNHYNSDKKKTFFFFSEEWRHEKNVTSAPPDSNGSPVVNVPSDAERGVNTPGFGNFTDVCAPVKTLDCPNVPDFTKVPITSVGQALLAEIPRSNTTAGVYPGTNVPLPAFRQTVSEPTTWREELVRIDHNLTNNYRLTFRYIHDSWQTVVPEALWGNNLSYGSAPGFQNITTGFVGPGTSFVARLNANITPTLLNEFVASFTADHIFLTANGPAGLPTGFTMGSIFPGQAIPFGGLLPSFTLGSNPEYGNGSGFQTDTGYFPWNNANPTYTYRDNLTKVAGTHTLQFGAYLVFAQKNEQNSPNLQGILNFSSGNATVSSGNAFADLLLGNISSYQQWSAKAKYYNRYRIVEPYFQDDWRITKRLTLNLGLRVSLFGTYRERYKQAFNFDPSAFSQANAPAPASAANGFSSPDFNGDGSLKVVAGKTINPLNGVVQCGGAGGNLSLVPGSAFPTVSVGSNPNAGCLKGHLFNAAPRIGFAYDPKGDGKMAIRGGYGIFYEHTNGNEGNTESLEGSAPLVLNATQSNICSGVSPCPLGVTTGGYSGIGGAGAGVPIFPLSPLSIPNRVLWPYMQQWNLNIQKELPSHIVLSVSYVGSKGTHLTLVNNLNQLAPTPASANPYVAAKQPITPPIQDALGNPIYAGDCSTFTVGPGGAAVTGQAALNLNIACGNINTNTARTAYPGYGSLNELRDIADSHYHSLQATANRTFGDLTLSLAYNYSHSIDDSSDRGDTAFVNAYNIRANRASSNFDQRHSLSLSYVYGLPIFKGSGLAHSVLGGWQVSGITVAQKGLPFSVTNGSTYGDNAGVANGTGTGSRPDLVGNPRSGFTANQDPGVAGPLFYNPAAFAVPTGLTFGDVGRNTLNLPGRVNFNFSTFKRFTINEKTGFEFRWESFNIFNHTQFNNIDKSMPTPIAGSFAGTGFLHLTGTHDPRRMQFGLRFFF